MINHLCNYKSEIPLTPYQKATLSSSVIVSLAIAVISALVLTSLYVPGLHHISQAFSFMATVEAASIGISLGVVLSGISLLHLFLRACGSSPQIKNSLQGAGDEPVDDSAPLNPETAYEDDPPSDSEENPINLTRREILETMALGFPEQSIFENPSPGVYPLEQVSDVIQTIASFLPESDILSLQSVSKRLCNTLRQKNFWTKLQEKYGLDFSEDLDLRVTKACLLIRCGAAFRRVARRIRPYAAHDQDARVRIQCEFISTKGMHVYKDRVMVFKDVKTDESLSLFSKDGSVSYPFPDEKFDYFHPLNSQLIIVKANNIFEIRSLTEDFAIKLEDQDRAPYGASWFSFCATLDKLVGVFLLENSPHIARDCAYKLASLKIWNFDGTLIRSHEINLPLDMQFSNMAADNDRIILISKQGEIFLFNLQNLDSISNIEKYFFSNPDLPFERYGKTSRRFDGNLRDKYPCSLIQNQFLCTGSSDGTISVWNLNTNTRNDFSQAHSRCVTCLSLSGNILLSGSMDGTVKIWDLVTMRYCGKILSRKGYIECLGIFENTVWISNDEGISFFDFTPKELLSPEAAS